MPFIEYYLLNIIYEYDTIIEYYYEYVIIIYSTDFIVLTFGVGPSAHNRGAAAVGLSDWLFRFPVGRAFG